MTLRNSSTHAHYCHRLETATGKLKNDYSTAWGINRNSVLNTLKYANVCEELLPPDIMHDILEGYLPYLCKQLLNHLKSAANLTLDYLNQSISNFNFEGDKPSPIPESVTQSLSGTTFGQSGM